MFLEGEREREQEGEGMRLLATMNEREAIELSTFGLRIHLRSWKILRIPKSFCFCGLYLSIFTILESKTDKKNF